MTKITVYGSVYLRALFSMEVFFISGQIFSFKNPSKLVEKNLELLFRQYSGVKQLRTARFPQEEKITSGAHL